MLSVGCNFPHVAQFKNQSFYFPPPINSLFIRQMWLFGVLTCAHCTVERRGIFSVVSAACLFFFFSLFSI